MLPTMGRRIFRSPAAPWRLARFGVLALVAFIAVNGLTDVWIAAVVSVVVATLSLIDDVVSRRAGADRGSTAPA